MLDTKTAKYMLLIAMCGSVVDFLHTFTLYTCSLAVYVYINL